MTVYSVSFRESTSLFYLIYEAQDLKVHIQYLIKIPTDLPGLLVLGIAWLSFVTLLIWFCRGHLEIKLVERWVEERREEWEQRRESLRTAIS